MSYPLSIRLEPPKEPNAIFSFLGSYFRMPSAWRWLSRLWGRNLLSMKGYAQMIHEMSCQEAAIELPKWEASYLIVEKYHDFLEQQLHLGKLRGNNVEEFFRIVAATKAETANVVTNLLMASRPKKKQTSSESMTESLAEIGMGNLIQLAIK